MVQIKYYYKVLFGWIYVKVGEWKLLRIIKKILVFDHVYLV